jgi:hypothetical protein
LISTFAREVSAFFGQDEFAISQSKLVIRSLMKLMDLGDFTSYIYGFAGLVDKENAKRN